MKIVFFVPKLINCGPLNVVLSIIKILSSSPEISIRVITYRDNHFDNKFMEMLKDAGVLDFYSLENYSNPVSKFLYLMSIVRDCHVIHSHGFFPDFYSSILPLNIKKVSTAHSIFFKDYPATYGYIKGYIYASLHHLVYLCPAIDKIVSCSKSVQNYLIRFSVGNKSRVLTIHNGVNKDTFYSISKLEKLALRSTMLPSFLSCKSNIFIFSGRLTRLKRVPELIKWFNALPNIIDNSNVLIILGDGEEMDICKEAVNNNENILLMGFVDDVTLFYQISDYIISFSAFEGFPMSILEGMSCGCKALLSDIPSHRELVHYFPNMAALYTEFKICDSNFFCTEEEAYYLSSVRMAEEYKSIYRCEL